MELKPCPFCGHTRLRFYENFNHEWSVCCDYCEASSGAYGDGYTVSGKERASKAWNSRRNTPAKKWVGDED